MIDGLGDLAPAVQAALARMNAQRWADRINAKDGTVWTPDPAKAEEIAGWMGWLDVAADLFEETAQFDDLRHDLHHLGYTHAVLCGMGGSSLCPDVLRRTFPRGDEGLELLVLDSTDPSTIAAVEAQIDVLKTVFIIASKSGGTTETLSHYRYFWERVAAADAENPGQHFIAITDDGSGLHQGAVEKEFGWVFLNPGLELGAVLGVAAQAGRDKCTLVCSPRVGSLGIWLEQLLAESTGKEGKGIVPVEGEALGPPAAYGADRLFVHVRIDGADAEQDAAVEALRAAGQPVYTIDIEGPDDLGGEFLRWEVATAAAGAVLGINPFDQPNVQESKDNTKAVLERYLEAGDFGVEPPADPWADVDALLGGLRAGDYFAILGYTEMGEEIDNAFHAVRRAVRDGVGVATTSGYGPRYLHSTGQLHKGGPNSGVYLILADERGEDIAIPEELYGFKTLIHAQWAGDLKSLRDHGRRAAMLPLADDRGVTLHRLRQVAERLGAR
ncbi:MAG: transaldolase / glucose-6-phosphate isomerase [Chloroflexota bacterium]|nr:transaldolase / glucose-6-phosphate isomerase [Chloroflexota bacterium]